MTLGPMEPRVYACVDPMTGAETGHDKFKSALHVKAMGLAGDAHRAFQLRCPTCQSTSVQPWPRSGPDAP